MKKFLAVALSVVVVALAAGLLLYVLLDDGEDDDSLPISSSIFSSRKDISQQKHGLSGSKEVTDVSQRLSVGKCKGEEKSLLTHSPMDDADFSGITPYGLMVGAHVTPIDHQYFEPADRDLGADSYPGYAMADATLADIGTRKSQFGTDEYRLVFTMSCKLFYYYDLLTSLSPDILAEFEAKGGRDIAIPVKAGQVIGRIGGQTLDFAVWDLDVRLPGFISEEMYADAEPWKIYTVDPLDYYTPALRERLLAKYTRLQDPVSGKIDHDVPGKLIGNWFLKDTKGYGGLHGEGFHSYWSGHLAIAPNHLDPSGMMASFGDWAGEAKQFALGKDALHPSEVGVQDGLVRYDLFQFSYKDGGGRHSQGSAGAAPFTFVPQQRSEGCVLFQVLPDEELQMETIVGHGCTENMQFTEAAQIYER